MDHFCVAQRLLYEICMMKPIKVALIMTLHKRCTGLASLSNYADTSCIIGKLVNQYPPLGYWPVGEDSSKCVTAEDSSPSTIITIICCLPPQD